MARRSVPIQPHRPVGECYADACDGGRRPCPCPDACQISTDRRERALVFRVYFVALAVVAAAAAWAVLW